MSSVAAHAGMGQSHRADGLRALFHDAWMQVRWTTTILHLWLAKALGYKALQVAGLRSAHWNEQCCNEQRVNAFLSRTSPASVGGQPLSCAPGKNPVLKQGSGLTQ